MGSRRHTQLPVQTQTLGVENRTAKAIKPTLFASAMSGPARIDFGFTNIRVGFENKSHPSCFSGKWVFCVIYAGEAVLGRKLGYDDHCAVVVRTSFLPKRVFWLKPLDTKFIAKLLRFL